MSHEVIDLSNYQQQFSRADAAAVKAHGVESVAIGRQRVNRAWEASEAAAALDAGLGIVGEYLINVGGEWPQPLPESRFIAVDVEPGSEFITAQAIDDALAFIATTGRIPVIYSSSWAWNLLGLANLTKYGDQEIALWDAYYDGRADGFDLPTPFGGWSACAIDQYTEHGDFGIGYPLDRDEVSDEFWTLCYPASEFDAPQAPAWAVAAASTQDQQEATVEIRQLDQGESIAALNKAAAVHGLAINDQNGETVVEVTAGSPVTPPPGGRVFLFTTKD